MMKILLKNKKTIIGMILLVFGYYLPELFDFFIINMIVDIRKAIVSGDSGHLVLTGALWSFFLMLQHVLLLNGIIIMTNQLARRLSGNKGMFILIYMLLYGFVLLCIDQYSFLPVAFIPSLFAGLIALILISVFASKGDHIERNIMISVQVFFVFEWINIMPLFSGYGFHTTDIPMSIKVAAVYLGSTSVIDFIGLVFLCTFALSTIMTTFLFSTHDRNVAIAMENYEKELALDSIRQKAVQNRMYEEINSITHDLKTPLVTIRGLNSLISLSDDLSKKNEYTERIDNAVTKMTDMISGFLYESSKQVVSTESIIDYVRAQIPVEDEKLKVSFNLEGELPGLYINKVRVSRALINIIENAMSVPTTNAVKKVIINVYSVERYVIIEITDNGVGIPESQMNKVWNVGFSTKESTGLGLAFGKKVIEDNEGTIEIKSIVSVGTTVRITLPDEASANREEL